MTDFVAMLMTSIDSESVDQLALRGHFVGCSKEIDISL